MAFDKKKVFYFSQTKSVPKTASRDFFGIRARLALDLAEMKLPVLPGLIINSEVADEIEKVDYKKDLESYFTEFSKELGKAFGDENHPLLIKFVISPNMVISQYPILHNIGLAKDTVEGFADKVGGTFAANEILFLIIGILKVEKMIAESTDDKKYLATVDKTIDSVTKDFKSKEKKQKALSIIEKYEGLLPEGFFESAKKQIEVMLTRVSYLLEVDEQNDHDTAILIHPMVYGNYTKDSSSGICTTRNVITGEKVIQGMFYNNAYDELFSPGKNISQFDKKYVSQLTKTAEQLEDTFKDIRQIRFTVENGKLWLIEQKSVEQKSTASLIKLYFDLLKRKIIDDKTLIQSLKPEQLTELLHPVIEEASIKGLDSISGGVSGAPGAAVGRVYFSTEDLLDAKRLAKQQGEDTRCILLMHATYAGDVKAIEEATGVLSNEGGYSAHASVVARQYGKVSLVKPDMVITGKKAKIGNMVIQSGDYLTIHVPYYGSAVLYKGKASLVQPNPDKLGLFDMVALTKKYVGNFQVRANADSARDAGLSLKFGADGIGLCRTEHMFFQEERINLFRNMVLSQTEEERKKILADLKKIQIKDFYGLLKAMQGKPVTIRLLDAPLHEFLPHNETEKKEYLDYAKNCGIKMTKAALEAQMIALSESNPMLGHRGCRIAISHPEIYEMQVSALFEAACKLSKEKIKVFPEVMIPIIMNAAELKTLIYGKKIEGYTYTGLAEIAQEVCKKNKVTNLKYSFGTMIELPCAALSSAEIARYAEFFSFGTNDLTQTCLGLSRDDFTSFMPDYTMLDLIDGNPFSVLDSRVKELIELSTKRGTEARPDLSVGLCGEHGARPENIQFCMNAGLHYVSCSPYSVPIALLAVAQENLKKEG